MYMCTQAPTSSKALARHETNRINPGTTQRSDASTSFCPRRATARQHGIADGVLDMPNNRKPQSPSTLSALSVTDNYAYVYTYMYTFMHTFLYSKTYTYTYTDVYIYM